MAAGAVSLRKSHDIIISSFCNIVKGQANYEIIIVSNILYLKNFDEFSWRIQNSYTFIAFSETVNYYFENCILKKSWKCVIQSQRSLSDSYKMDFIHIVNFMS